MEHGHHICPHASWIHVSVCSDRRAQPLHRRMEVQQHVGQVQLHRTHGRMHCQARDAGNREHRPRKPIYIGRLDQHIGREGNKHKYGWPRKMQGQHLDRAFLADNKAGIHLPIPYGCGVGSACRNRQIYGVLQRTPSTSESRKRNPAIQNIPHQR